MVSAIVLGDRGAGTTTFLGLLYASLVRWGVQEGQGFRVHASHATLRAIKEVYASLLSGEFPPRQAELKRPELSFVLEYPPQGVRRMLPAREPRGLTLHVADVQELAELHGRSVVMDDGLRGALESRIAIVLVDASRLPEDDAAGALPGHHPFRRFDSAVASTLALLQAYRSLDPHRRRTHLHPLFVLTKLDAMTSALTLRPEGSLPPPSASLGRRRAWGESLLASRIPQTWGVLTGQARGVRFDGPWFFGSGLQLDPGPSGSARIRRRPTAAIGGWEPAYPREEYDAMLALLEELTRESPLLSA